MPDSHLLQLALGNRIALVQLIVLHLCLQGKDTVPWLHTTPRGQRRVSAYVLAFLLLSCYLFLQSSHHPLVGLSPQHLIWSLTRHQVSSL